MTIPLPPNPGPAKGHYPYEDLKLTVDRSGTSVMRSFTIETHVDVPDDEEGRKFWDRLDELLKNPSHEARLATYEHVFGFANQFLLAPGTGRAHAIVQAAFGVIDVNQDRIPPVPDHGE